MNQRLDEILARCDSIRNGVTVSEGEIMDYVLHARRDIPYLLAEVERLRSENERQSNSLVVAARVYDEAACELATLKAEVERLQERIRYYEGPWEHGEQRHRRNK